MAMNPYAGDVRRDTTTNKQIPSTPTARIEGSRTVT